MLDPPERLEQLQQVFLKARDAAPAERSAILDEHCGDDAELRAQLERLLTTVKSQGILDDPIHNRLDANGSVQALRIGPYRLHERIGSGGMGEVYRAVDERLGRTVALKVAPITPGGSPVGLTSEARAASALNHPNVATVYDIGHDEATEYVAMEFIGGTPLSEWIRPEGMPLNEVVSFARQIAEALVATHAAGIVHRDLKPANVMITDRGQVKVLDFGVAAPSTAAAFADPQARAGSVAGTPAYMSPEQATGAPIDSRSDLFSFGVLLYQMVTGRQPFTRDTDLATLNAVVEYQPARAATARRDVPADLDRLIARCLRKNREERIGTAAEVVQTITSIAAAHTTTSTATIPHPSDRKWAWAGLALLVVGLAALWTWRSSSRRMLPAAEPVLTQMTFDPGLSAYPWLSGDGRLLVYAADREEGGSLDLWLKQVAGENPIRLTSDPADDYDPALSPDATKVVFRSERAGGGLYVVQALGGDSPRLLAPRGRAGRFSPDGKWIAYWTGETGREFLPGSGRLSIISAQGGEPRPLSPQFSSLQSPVWTPDGKYILALGRARADRPPKETLDWWAIPVEGGEPIASGVIPALDRRGLHAPLGLPALSPAAWIQGTKSILFSGHLGDSSNVWQVDLSGPNWRTEGLVQRRTFGAGLELYPAVAAASELIAFSNLNLNVDVWTAPRQAGDSPKMIRVSSQVSHEAYPSISSDGSRIVYARSVARRHDVVLRDTVTGKERTIRSQNWGPIPKLSRDGKLLAYWSEEKSGVLMELETGKTAKFCSRCGPPTDIAGSTVVFESIGEPHSLLAAENDEAPARVLIEATKESNGIPYSGKLSPDRRWIAFHLAERNPTRKRIYIAAATGSPIREAGWTAVTAPNVMAYEPAWSPDGSQLFYVSEQDGFRCIWGQRFSGTPKRPAGAPEPVLHLHRARLSLSSFGSESREIGLSIANDQIVLAMGELTGNIWARRDAATH